MAQPLRGLAPQIPNAPLVWNLKSREGYSENREVTSLLQGFPSLEAQGPRHASGM